jgi:hypothetical protein
MRRHLLGLFAASVTAPYLVVFFMILSGQELPYGPAINETALYGTISLVVFGLPLFGLASLSALVVAAAGWSSGSGAVFGGAILGFCLMAVIRDGGAGMIIGALSGAICGWIYWRIATGGQPKAPLA